MKIMLASAHCVHETAAYIRILFLILPFCCYFIAKSYYISYHIDISGTKSQNPFSVLLVKIELWAFSESLGPLLSIPPPVMTVAGL